MDEQLARSVLEKVLREPCPFKDKESAPLNFNPNDTDALVLFAHRVIDAMREKGFDVLFGAMFEGRWFCTFGAGFRLACREEAPTFPEAVFRAAMKAVGLAALDARMPDL